MESTVKDKSSTDLSFNVKKKKIFEKRKKIRNQNEQQQRKESVFPQLEV